MSSMSHGVGTGPRDRIVFGTILLGLGFLGLALQLLEPRADLGGLIVLGIGVGLLGAFAYTRQYGYLVPGGIMTGIGSGILVSQSVSFTSDEGTGGVIVLGLGLGFVAIWVIGALVQVSQHHWWPLVPGTILAIVGGALLIGDRALWLLDYWGVAVIAVGLLVLWRGWVEGHRGS
jgi:hypothetical protein